MGKLLAFLKREPVAVWGALITAVLALPALAGVPAWVGGLVAALCALLGIPIVRPQVTPTASAPADPQAGYGLVEIALFLLILAIALVVLRRNGLF